MSTADHVAWTGYVGPYLQVEVDDSGNIQVAVGTNAGANLKPDGFVRADVGNVQSLHDALNAAQRVVAAVFPRAGQGDEFTWRQRAEAYSALTVAGKIGIMKDQLGKEVTLFLGEYVQAEKAATEGGKRPHMTMSQYAAEYERWW